MLKKCIQILCLDLVMNTETPEMVENSLNSILCVWQNTQNCTFKAGKKCGTPKTFLLLIAAISRLPWEWLGRSIIFSASQPLGAILFNKSGFTFDGKPSMSMVMMAYFSFPCFRTNALANHPASFSMPR